jgi:ribosomal protein S20
MQSARPRGRKRHGANRTKRSRIRAAIKAMTKELDKAEGATPEIRTAQPPQRGGFT